MDLVRELLPYTVREFVGRRSLRSLDRMMLDDQRIQLYHCIVVMQHINDDLAGDIWW